MAHPTGGPQPLTSTTSWDANTVSPANRATLYSSTPAVAVAVIKRSVSVRAASELVAVEMRWKDATHFDPSTSWTRSAVLGVRSARHCADVIAWDHGKLPESTVYDGDYVASS